MDKHILFQDGRVGLTLFHVLLICCIYSIWGTCQYIIASILYSIAFNFGMMGDLDANLVLLEEHVKHVCARLNTSAGEQVAHNKFMQNWEGGRMGVSE